MRYVMDRVVTARARKLGDGPFGSGVPLAWRPWVRWPGFLWPGPQERQTWKGYR